MIDFLPVTWKCCFYSAHFQPGGLFDKDSAAKLPDSLLVQEKEQAPYIENIWRY